MGARQYLRSAATALVRPPVLGALYLLALTVIASSDPIVADGDHALGAQAREVGSFVVHTYGGEMRRIALAIVATAALVGALLGAVAGGLVRVRRALARQKPLEGPRLTLASLPVLVALHGAFYLRAVARSPQLYAEGLYARGGVRRVVQVFVTDILGVHGATALAVLALVVYVAGPRRAWPMWLDRAKRALSALRAVVTPGRAAVTLALLLLRTVPTLGTAHAAAAPSAGGPMNVLVLAADSLRADRLTPRVAPHLSELAARGTRFDRAYVSLPRTFPSWVTILTGRHPHHHGVRSMFARWDDRAKDFDALPQRLHKAGYATGVVSDYAGDIFGRVDLGFEQVDTPSFDFVQMIRQRALERQTPLLPFLHSRAGRTAFPVLREMNQAADPDMLADDAIAMLRGQGDKPFFMTVFFSAAHFPYAAPAPYYARFTDPTYRGPFKYHKPVGLGGADAVSAADVQQVRGLFDGAVASIDDAMARILAELDARGLRERTIIVVTADHGETLFDNEHGQGHGDHLFGDEATHVPLVIVDPRHPTARRDERIVRDVDLAATLYALTGTPPPADLDGVSLAPALDGASTPKSFAYAETELWLGEVPALPDALRLPYPSLAHLTEIDTAHGQEIVLQRELEPITTVARHRMVRDERWKLLYVPTRTGVKYMLYDTVADPEERTDVAAAHPAEVTRLEGELWRWMLGDKRMVERGGYLVPRDLASLASLGQGQDALRIPGGAP
ncbi:MAG TPA: sulfatase [Polyangiaceae bacterium]